MPRGPFWRAQTWAAEYLISIHSMSGDFRWAVAALLLRGFVALEAFVQRQLVALARSIMGRAMQGARFAAGTTNADRMVAAGGS